MYSGSGPFRVFVLGAVRVLVKPPRNESGRDDYRLEQSFIVKFDDNMVALCGPRIGWMSG
jgi:hypothetical protein